MNIDKPKAILFDWDGTIVDTWPIITAASEATMIAYGKLALYKEISGHISKHKSARDVFPIIFGEKWQEASDLYRYHYKKMRAGYLKLMPHARELLDFLSRDPDLYLAVISNKQGDSLREEIAMMGFQSYFTKVVGSGDSPHDKPTADPAYIALSSSNITKYNEVWIVGDSVVDMECAHNVGCHGIFYGNDVLKATADIIPPLASFLSHDELLLFLKRFY